MHIYRGCFSVHSELISPQYLLLHPPSKSQLFPPPSPWHLQISNQQEKKVCKNKSKINSSPRNFTLDMVQPKTSSFSTRHLIWGKLKFVSQLFQLIYLAFSYLNSVRHFQALNCVVSIFYFFSTVPEKINVQFFLPWIFLIFSIMHISTFNSPKISQFCG